MSKVFIIILNWNGRADTIECLESLRKIGYRDYKIVVVDNGSTDGSADVIPKKYFQDVAFIETKKNLGFAGGNNIGINYALENDAEFILLLNNDTIVEPDFLTELVKAAQADDKIGIVGPMINFYDNRDTIWFGGGKINWLKTKGSHVSYGLQTTRSPLTAGSDYSTGYLTGCCLLIKRKVIEKIGFLSEDYFLYYEDTDWCLRSRQAGFETVLAPAAKIYHKQSRSAQEFSYPYVYYHSRNGLILGSKFGPRFLIYLLSAWIFLKQMVKLVLGYKKNWARPVMRGVTDFWRGRRGKLEGYY